MYIPCTIASFAFLGEQTPRHILDQLDKDNLVYKTALVLMTIHLLLSISIMMHPLCEEFEKVCGVNREGEVSPLCKKFEKVCSANREGNVRDN